MFDRPVATEPILGTSAELLEDVSMTAVDHPATEESVRAFPSARDARSWLVANERAFLDYMRQGARAECTALPSNIVIEPVNACNLNCPFCATTYETRPRALLSIELFQTFIADLSGHGVYPRLTFAGEGEPFLNKKTIELVRIAKDAGFVCWMITNGTMLNAKRINKLLDTGIDRIQFSIDSVKPEIYNQMRRAKGQKSSYFEEAMGNILHTLRRNVELGSKTEISISSVQTSLNASDAEEFRAFWAKLPVHHVYLAPFSTLQANSPMEEAKQHYFTGDMKTKPVCSVPFANAKLNADGSINLCTHDYNNVYPVGNVRDESFLSLWNNEKSRQLRQALIDAEVEDFVAMGHDCRQCNNPVLGCGMGEFVAASESRIQRLLNSMNETHALSDIGWRMEQLAQLAERFPVAA